MRYVSWVLSFTLHVAMAVLLIQHVHMPQAEVRELLEIDLVELEQPEQVIVPMPQPEPAPPEPTPPPPEPLPEPEPPAPEPPVAAPLPMDKTIALDAAPPPPAPAVPEPVAEPESAPIAEPDVAVISPVKTPRTAPEAEKPEPPQTQEQAADRIVARRDDIVAHRGHEARFGRSMMADYYSYSSSEFSGQFKARDRTVSIIDARKTEYGRFLLYDSKHKTLRRLQESGKYVYTIGPSLYADEPVQGVVVFLAKNDRIERFILMSKDDRIANFPVKIHVREEEVSLPTNEGPLTAYVSMPPEGTDLPGVVMVHGDRCVDSGLVLGFTRSLSAEGLASLSVVPRWCGNDRPADSEARLVSDTRAGLSHFGSVAPVNFRHVGLWGNGPGVPFAVRASSGGALSPAYMVCMLTDAADPATMPDQDDLARLTMPVLWLVTGKGTEKWRGYIDTLEALREDKGKRFTIVLAPTPGDHGVPDDLLAGAGWVESVTEDHARLAVSWIEQIDG